MPDRFMSTSIHIDPPILDHNPSPWVAEHDSHSMLFGPPRLRFSDFMDDNCRRDDDIPIGPLPITNMVSTPLKV